MGRPPAKRKAESKAPPDAAAAKAAKLEAHVREKVSQKLRENFKSLADEEIYINVDPQSGMTLKDKLTSDVKARESGAHVFVACCSAVVLLLFCCCSAAVFLFCFSCAAVLLLL